MKLHTRKVHFNGPQPLAKCVACNDPVTPGFCYTGSVISGRGFATKTDYVRVPIYRDTSTGELIGGDVVEWKKKISFLKYKKGFICCKCASDYRTVEGQLMIKTDPAPGFMGQLAIPLIERPVKSTPTDEPVHVGGYNRYHK